MVLHVDLAVSLAGEGGVEVGESPLGLQVSQFSLVDVVVRAVSAAEEEVSRPQLDACMQQKRLMERDASGHCCTRDVLGE